MNARDSMHPMRKSSERAPRRLSWLVAGLAATVLLAGTGFAREALRARQIDQEIRALKQEAESLRVRNFQVSSLQASLESGEFLEREARMKLGLQKEGERVVVLRKDAPQAPKNEASSAPAFEEWSNAKKWWISFADPHAFAEYVRSRNARPSATTPNSTR